MGGGVGLGSGAAKPSKPPAPTRTTPYLSRSEWLWGGGREWVFLRLRLLEGGRWYLVPASPPAFPLRLSMSCQERAWNLGGKAGGGAGKIEAPKASFNPPSLGTPRKNSAEGRGFEGGNQFPIAFAPYRKSRIIIREWRLRGQAGGPCVRFFENKAEILSIFLGNFFVTLSLQIFCFENRGNAARFFVEKICSFATLPISRQNFAPLLFCHFSGEILLLCNVSIFPGKLCSFAMLPFFLKILFLCDLAIFRKNFAPLRFCHFSGKSVCSFAILPFSWKLENFASLQFHSFRGSNQWEMLSIFLDTSRFTAIGSNKGGKSCPISGRIVLLQLWLSCYQQGEMLPVFFLGTLTCSFAILCLSQKKVQVLPIFLPKNSVIRPLPLVTQGTRCQFCSNNIGVAMLSLKLVKIKQKKMLPVFGQNLWRVCLVHVFQTLHDKQRDMLPVFLEWFWGCKSTSPIFDKDGWCCPFSWQNLWRYNPDSTSQTWWQTRGNSALFKVIFVVAIRPLQILVTNRRKCCPFFGLGIFRLVVFRCLVTRQEEMLPIPLKYLLGMQSDPPKFGYKQGEMLPVLLAGLLGAVRFFNIWWLARGNAVNFSHFIWPLQILAAKQEEMLSVFFSRYFLTFNSTFQCLVTKRRKCCPFCSKIELGS